MAQTDIQPLLDSQPPALPANVARVTADGRPTTHLVGWEVFQTNWFKNNIIATDQRIDTVRAEAGDALAEYREEVNAIIGPDGSLIQKVDTVEARANKATANGQIFFGAMATPAGATAAYGIFLEAGDVFTGFQMIAKTDGTSAIVFDANQFLFNDSGTAQNVFTYGYVPAAGQSVFQFNVPVWIGTLDLAQQAVNAPVAASSSTTINLSSTGGWQTILSATADGDPGYVAVIFVDFTYEMGGGSGVLNGQWRVRRSDGDIIRSGQLAPYADEYDVTVARLDTSFTANYTYTLQVNVEFPTVTSGSPYVSFKGRGLMIDMRKR